MIAPRQGGRRSRSAGPGQPGIRLCARPRRRRARGQSLVEMAIVLPVMISMLALAYTGWDAIHRVIGITSAARAGALQAAADLPEPNLAPLRWVPPSSPPPPIPVPASGNLHDETQPVANAVNAEENSPGLYKPSGNGWPACTTACVSLSAKSICTSTPATPCTSAVPIITVTITRSVSADVPVFRSITVTAIAGASLQ